MKAIANDSPTEAVKLYFDLFTAVQKCKKKDNEKVSAFVERSKGAIPGYRNNTSVAQEFSSRHFATLML